MKKQYDVAIVGAGIIGTMIARELSRYQLKICVLEKESDVAMGATGANSAIVHAGFDAKEGTYKAKFNVRGSYLMPKVAKELGVKYQNNGSLVLGFNEQDCKMLQQLYDRGRINGVQGLELLDKDRLRRLEPNVSENAVYALYAPTGAIVCPYELTFAALGNAMDNGVQLKLNFAVTSILKEQDCYIISSQTESVKAKYLINGAGLFSDEIAKMAGDDSFTIRPRKGQYLLLDKECGKLVKHTIFKVPTERGKGILVSPTVDGNLILGPTSEDIQDKTDKRVTLAGVDKIIKEFLFNVNSIPLHKVITSFSGLRAVGDTGDFIINSNMKNFINVAAIESPGLSAAPAIAEHVVGMLEEMGLSLEENPEFNPYRPSMYAFSKMSIEEKNVLISKNSKYGKMVCRCEKVSEGEIIDAIKAHPRATTLDGIKRRTRAGMGRCQGGFCSPLIIEVLAKELGIPFEEVTKSGGKSYINFCKTKGGNNDGTY